MTDTTSPSSRLAFDVCPLAPAAGDPLALMRRGFLALDPTEQTAVSRDIKRLLRQRLPAELIAPPAVRLAANNPQLESGDQGAALARWLQRRSVRLPLWG